MIIQKENIKQAVINMLRVNMGIKTGERVLVVTDYPAEKQWVEKSDAEIEIMLSRNLLARQVGQLVRDHFMDCCVDFYAYPAAGGHGVEPGEKVAQKMLQSDVILAITNFSLSHTKARGRACREGARVASMPLFLPKMFFPGGPMDVDYIEVAAATRKIARCITEANTVQILQSGTDLTLSVAGRTGREDNGLYIKPGSWGNLPAGEAYTAPVEEIGEGQIMVGKGWYPGLKENMIIFFNRGRVVAVEGGGEVGRELVEILGLRQSTRESALRRNLAEFAIGTNPNARKTDNILEAEKVKGTVHIAIGDSSQIGGTIISDYHQDFIIPEPDVYFDGKLVMKAGEWHFDDPGIK